MRFLSLEFFIPAKPVSHELHSQVLLLLRRDLFPLSEVQLQQWLCTDSENNFPSQFLSQAGNLQHSEFRTSPLK